jgi:hypothetical protein
MCFQLSYTLFQCLASWVANELVYFFFLKFIFIGDSTFLTPSQIQAVIYCYCIILLFGSSDLYTREDHVKTPKLKVHFRGRRSAQIKLKKTTEPYFEIYVCLANLNKPMFTHNITSGHEEKGKFYSFSGK